MIDLMAVQTALEQVLDPEIGIDVVNLGLIYAMEEQPDHTLRIAMTMTTPGCPAHDSLSFAVQCAAEQVPGVTSVQVEVVWNPPWTPEKMSDFAKARLAW